jgi:hypothetical protein
LGQRPVIRRWSHCVAAWLAVTTCLTSATALAQPAAPQPLPNGSSLDAWKAPDEHPISLLRATVALPTADVPENVAAPRLVQEGVSHQPTGLGRGWTLQPYEWDPTALRHLPLYFEEPNLERLGYYYGCPECRRIHNVLFCSIDEYRAALRDEKAGCRQPLECYCHGCDHCPQHQLLQPMVSAAHFFGRVAAIPYMVGAEHPHCEVYEFGRDRPGSPVPYRKYYMPLSLKGAIYEGAAATGIGFIIP